MPNLMKYVIPPLIIFAAVVGVRGMKAMSPEAERSAPPPQVARVSVSAVQQVDTPAMVRVTGTVEAAREVVVMSQVGGAIVSQSDELVPGGRLARGDVLLRVDPRDYRLGVEQERSRVRQAQLEVELERGRQDVAQREWAAVNSGRGADSAAGEDSAPVDGAPLALRLPQMATAERSLSAANAGLARAELALERATLRAPFNAIVVDESAEVGQVVGAGTRIATLVGTDLMFVRASVPVDRLPFIDIPGMNGSLASRATVTHELGAGASVSREARVLRLVGSLDPQSRTAQLILGVDSPLDVPSGAPPLLPGAYVDVEIEGKIVQQVFPVSRAAVIDGNSVWIVTPENTLARRRLEVQWRSPETLFVGAGLEPGVRVVTSPMALPIEGMPVEVLEGVDAGDPVENSETIAPEAPEGENR